MYRKATITDCEPVYHLICEMEGKNLPYDRFCAIYSRQLACGSFHCLICDLENQVAGVLSLRCEDQLHHAAPVAEIMEFAVAPEFRRQGVGKEMLKLACELAKELGCVQIEVACNQLRTDAHRFYLREGMHNFHFKFSKALMGNDTAENAIGK